MKSLWIAPDSVQNKTNLPNTYGVWKFQISDREDADQYALIWEKEMFEGGSLSIDRSYKWEVKKNCLEIRNETQLITLWKHGPFVVTCLNNTNKAIACSRVEHRRWMNKHK
jgi:hypothetical protein